MPAGLLSLVLSAILTIYFLIPPVYSLAFTYSDIRSVILFIIQGIVLLWLINKLNKANEKNARLSALKDEFISIASHELKTPLTSMKAYTQLLQTFLKGNDNKKSLAVTNRMSLQIDKLTQLINELLDVSKIQAGKLDFKLETFYIDELVDEIVTDMQNLYPSHKLTVKKERSEKNKKLIVLADKYRLSQVLENIISNAVKYSPQADHIVIKTFREKVISQEKAITECAAISVQDFGIGLGQHDMHIIFEKFSQVDTDIQLGSAGLGLGLYISAEIIKRHNGTIEVKSNKGKGSTFTIKIPLVYQLIR